MHMDFRASELIEPNEQLHNVARSWLQKTDFPTDIHRWVNFYSRPTLQMHPERWKSAIPAWRSLILQCLWARSYVDEYFRNLWGWKETTWTDLKNPLMRLAIKDFYSLQRVATFAGALIAVKEIRRTVDRKTVQMLRKGLGADILSFACTDTLHLKMNVPKKCQVQHWPGSDPVITVVNAGWLLIACASALLPTEEHKHFLCRLPHCVETAFCRCRFCPEDSQTAWYCLNELLKTI